MSIADNITKLRSEIPLNVTLVAVSKTHPVETVLEAYHAGCKFLGENKVQEMLDKYEQLPKDIEWHLIGHLQSNKVKYIAPFVHLIHSVDSLKLLQEINKQAIKNNRFINCLLQIYIAKEETKFGLDFNEAERLLNSPEQKQLSNVRIIGLMGMASNTGNEAQIRNEFHFLKLFFERLKTQDPGLKILSMGMTSDYRIAIEEGSNMIRLGSAIFGKRDYTAKK